MIPRRCRGLPGNTSHPEMVRLGEIHVHEFMTLDGVVDAPTWTFELPPEDERSDRRAGGTLAGNPARAYDLRDVRAVVVDPHGRGRPRSAVLQRHDEVRRVRLADGGDVTELRRRRLGACESYENGVVYLSYRPRV